MVRFRLPVTLAIGVLLVTIVGCGPSLYQPSGKLTKDGSTLGLSEKGYIQIALYADSDSKFSDPLAVNWEKDGTFKVSGKTGTGVPAGKYKLSVAIFDPYGPPGAKDILEGKMFKEKGKAIEIKDATEIPAIDIKK